MTSKLLPSSEEREAISDANIYSTSTEPDTDEAFIPLQFVELDFVPRTTWRRWPLLFLFANCILFVSASSLCLSPVSLNLANAYGVPQLMVNMCGISYTATFVPMTFASMWLYKRFPNHYVQKLGCFIFVAGAWSRFLCVYYGFWPVLMGQIIISLAQPIICNVIGLFCN
jgi:MFS transporter, FLVCR family, feline leukemia virus subgroup C receptor-related protein